MYSFSYFGDAPFLGGQYWSEQECKREMYGLGKSNDVKVGE